jgi:hypothetical protein
MVNIIRLTILLPMHSYSDNIPATTNAVAFNGVIPGKSPQTDGKSWITLLSKETGVSKVRVIVPNGATIPSVVVMGLHIALPLTPAYLPVDAPITDTIGL